MHLTVLACDLDGTLAENNEVAPETWEMLRQARLAGLVIILVTGRIMAELPAHEAFAELCEAIVSENGAAIYFPRRDAVVLPFGRLPPLFLQSLQALELPLQRGLAIVATYTPHDRAILKVLHYVGGGATVEYNRGAVMVLPPGATKGTGLCYALHELGYSPHNVVAFGDAENDRSLFEVAELAVAVSNASAEVQTLADLVLTEPNGAGVRSLVSKILTGQLPPRRVRPERRLLLGHQTDEQPVYLDPFTLIDSNLGVFGTSLSGKSWLAGLLAEKLLKQGYQVCIIDPEGDYRGLRTFPRSLVLGGMEKQLPPIVDVLTFIEYGEVSLVFDFSLYTTAECKTYLIDLLRALRALRARRGQPHWFLLDEIQNFCPTDEDELTGLLLGAMQEGGFGLISYRPSQVAPALIAALDHCLLTRLTIPEDKAALQSILSRQEPSLLAKLPTLSLGQAYLCVKNGGLSLSPAQDMITFDVIKRTVPHVRHLHKYLQAPLPRPKRFYFHDAAGRYLGRTAASLWEFREALTELPLESLQYHLGRGDFERWLREVFHDDKLAHSVQKLQHRHLKEELLRRALLKVVVDRYEELISLS